MVVFAAHIEGMATLDRTVTAAPFESAEDRWTEGLITQHLSPERLRIVMPAYGRRAARWLTRSSMAAG